MCFYSTSNFYCKKTFQFLMILPFQLLKHIPELSMTHESSTALETAPPWQQHFRDPPLSSCALPALSSSSYTTVVYLWIIFFPRLISFICLIAQIKVLYLAYAGLFIWKKSNYYKYAVAARNISIHQRRVHEAFCKQTLLVFDPASHPLTYTHKHISLFSLANRYLPLRARSGFLAFCIHKV